MAKEWVPCCFLDSNPDWLPTLNPDYEKESTRLVVA